MSDIDLVEFEDLEMLDGSDLRAVFEQVPDLVVCDALVGARPAMRQQLLTRLPSATASRLTEMLAGHGPVTLESARNAQQAIVEALCRLSRGGIIAFDHPADMVA